jgi:hypothetical protein
MTRVKQHLSLLSMCQLCNITTSHDRITLNDFPILWTAQPKPVLLKPSIMDEITHKIRSRDESSFVSSSIDSSEHSNSWGKIRYSVHFPQFRIVMVSNFYITNRFTKSLCNTRLWHHAICTTIYDHCDSQICITHVYIR